MSKIVVFSGTDGSGKSTQIDLLSDHLKNNKHKVVVVWGRGGYTPLFSFLKKILKNLLGGNSSKVMTGESRDRLLEKKSVSSVWLFVAMLDLFLFYGLYVRILNLFGFIVICDRYIEDTELDFNRNFPNIFNKDSLTWRALLRFVPRPDVLFLLYVPVDVSIARSKMKQEPFPDTPKTLTFRLESYLDESKFPLDKYCRIDCRGSIKDVHIKILREIEGKF